MSTKKPPALAADHDPATCSECRAAHRDMQRWLARIERLCRCCGSVVPEGQIVYIVADDPNKESLPLGEWRMCETCWRAGYPAGKTIDELRREGVAA
jgi:hypothetical protein